MIRKLLRLFGYYKIDYGFACGRYWVEIDGKTLAQTSGDDVWLRDEQVEKIQKVCLQQPETDNGQRKSDDAE